MKERWKKLPLGRKLVVGLVVGVMGCCGWLMVFAAGDAALRSAGVLPTLTATLTRTPTATATMTETRPPTDTPPPTETLPPTATASAPPLPSATATATETALPTATRTPTLAPAAVPTIRIDLISLSSPAPRNSDARLVIQVDAGTRCTPSVRYPSGYSQADGLQAKIAGEDGRLEWTWQVGPSTSQGTHQVSVNCGPGGFRAWPFVVE